MQLMARATRPTAMRAGRQAVANVGQAPRGEEDGDGAVRM